LQNNIFSTLFVGQNLIKLKDVDSTNNFLKSLASNSEPLPEGTVIMADNQFAGRGQQQNVWQTAPGKNISASIFLKPVFLPLSKQFYLNIAVSLAVSKALSEFLPEPVLVKWPNDIYYGSKKLGGILIENTLTGTSIKNAVIGIGLNINQQEFSGILTEKAISSLQILGYELNLQDVIGQICLHLEKYYLRVKAGQYDFLQKNYLERLYKYQKTGLFKQNGQVFEGKIVGVQDNGQLILEIDNRTEVFNFKEIEFIHT